MSGSIRLTVRQGRLATQAIYHGICARQTLVEAYTPKYGPRTPREQKIIRNTQREIARYDELRRNIFLQMENLNEPPNHIRRPG